MADKTTKEALKFTVVIEPADEGGFVVHVPALPGCHTQGETIDEAKANAQEAIECYLKAVQDMGEDIPKELEGTKIFTIVTSISLD